LDGLPTPRHTLGYLLPDGVPPGRRDLDLLRISRPYAPSRTVQAPGTNRLDVRRGGDAPTLGRGPTGPRPQTIRASTESTARRFVLVFGAQIVANTLFGDSVGDRCLDLLKIRPSIGRF
jgi:hypothetical protein